jgi:hypothetical protein
MNEFPVVAWSCSGAFGGQPPAFFQCSLKVHLKVSSYAAPWFWEAELTRGKLKGRRVPCGVILGAVTDR